MRNRPSVLHRWPSIFERSARPRSEGAAKVGGRGRATLLLESAAVATPPTVPVWQTWLGLVGISSLIATVLSNWLSGRRERLRWINDNKKAEWRELLDAIDKGHTKMYENFRSNDPNWFDGMEIGQRVIDDRIFIADAVRKFKLAEKWDALWQLALFKDKPPTDASYLGRGDEFAFKAKELQDALVEAARKDLGLW